MFRIFLLLKQCFSQGEVSCEPIPLQSGRPCCRLHGSCWHALRHVALCQASSCVMRCPSCAGGCLQGDDLLPAQALKIDRASYQAYSLPLKRGLTTGSTGNTRPGFLLHLSCSALDGSEARGVGEVAPLAGLQAMAALVCAPPVRMLSGLVPSSNARHSAGAVPVIMHIADDAVCTPLQGCTWRACLRPRSSWLS